MRTDISTGPDKIPTLAWSALGRRSADNNVAERLLREGLACDPDNLLLRRKLAGHLYDQSRLTEAIAVLEPAIRRADSPTLRLRGMIASAAGDLDMAVEMLQQTGPGASPGDRSMLALAIARRDGFAAAGPIASDILISDPDNWQALSIEASRLAMRGDYADLDHLCGTLERRGARNAELFAVWASARASIGHAHAGRLVDYDACVSVDDLWGEQPDAFNAALRDELLGHPNIIAPHSTRSTIGGVRIDDLRTVEALLVKQLVDAIRNAIDIYADTMPKGAFNPLGRYNGGDVTLVIWALILSGEAHEKWHIHPAGLISGVYYVDLPEAMMGDAGALELGLLPLGGADSHPGWRKMVHPRQGMIVLFPSSYAHRTIPTAHTANRISIAFDVVHV